MAIRQDIQQEQRTLNPSTVPRAQEPRIPMGQAIPLEIPQERQIPQPMGKQRATEQAIP